MYFLFTNVLKLIKNVLMNSYNNKSYAKIVINIDMSMELLILILDNEKK